MGAGPAIFQSAGQRSEHYVPGAYSRSAAVGVAGGGVSANNGVILGRAKGGQPGKLFTFGSWEDAKETLVDGDLLKAVAHAFNPSPDYSPQAIRAMVVNGNTQAAGVLKSGSLEILRIKTAAFGVVANSIARQIVNGTSPGTKKILFFSGETEDRIDNIGRKSIRLQHTGDGTAAILDVNSIGLSVEVTREDNSPAVDIDEIRNLRVGETKTFNIVSTNPQSADITVVARFDLGGLDMSLLRFEYFETAGGENTWKLLDVSVPFKSPGGFPLASGSDQFRITPLEGAEGSIFEYGVTFLQVINGEVTSNIIAQTTKGKTEIAAEGQPYSGYNIPAYDVNSGSVFIPFEDYPTVEEVVQRLDATGEFAAVQLESEANVPSNELDLVDSADVKSQPQTLTSNFFALVHALENSPWIGKGNVSKAEGAPNMMPDNDAEPVFFDGAGAGTYTVADWNKALGILEAENIQIISSPVTDHAAHTLISNHCTAMSNVQNRKERTALLGGPIGETIDEAVAFAGTLNNKLVSYCYPAISASSPLTGAAEDLPASYFACKLLGMECAVAVNEPLTWKTVNVLKFLAKLKTSEMEKLIIGGVLCGAVTDDNRLAVIRAVTTYGGNQLQLVERSMVREDLYMNRDIRAQYSAGVGRPGIDKGGDAAQVLEGAARGWQGEGLVIPNDDGKNVWGVSVRKSGDRTYISFNRNLTAPQNFFFITAYNYVYESAATVEV
ncbi:MAG: phage tail sheath subtilisin-like domain-containing protein [Spirochaetaceae bacterium]|jgi:hypothetical protein|nr:phage tail sheath subtilisin-like domain-containing protein [Spirochaetaceae bacterium]